MYWISFCVPVSKAHTMNTVFLFTCWWDWWRWRRWVGSRKGHSPIWTLCPPGPWGWDYRTGHWPDWCWLPSLLAVLSQTRCSSLLFHQAYAKTWDKENALIFGGTNNKQLGFKLTTELASSCVKVNVRMNELLFTFIHLLHSDLTRNRQRPSLSLWALRNKGTRGARDDCGSIG